jgi:hypothetical protein
MDCRPPHSTRMPTKPCSILGLSIARKLAALRALTEEVEGEAEALVDRLSDFAHLRTLATYLPVTIVSTATGLPEEGRKRMMESPPRST